MQKIIDIFGQTNIYIIFGVIVAIVIALLIILIIEKHSTNKYRLEFEKYEQEKNNKEKIEKFDEEPEVVFEPIIKDAKQEEKEIVYATDDIDKNEAKKAIEEAAKKLVYEEKPDIIAQTSFEKMQEESSIISYDELINSNIDVDKENDKVLEDEGNEPITIDELYGYQKENTIESIDEELPNDDTLIKKDNSFTINALDEENLVNDVVDDSSLDEMEYYVNEESKKFKNSDVISPVFGIKRDVIYKKEYNELGETIDIKELDMEIKRTEEFLKELKKLKNKLD